jgi:two-component system sensor histidine kinase AlgZ
VLTILGRLRNKHWLTPNSAPSPTGALPLAQPPAGARSPPQTGSHPDAFLPDFCVLDTTLVLVMSSLVLGLGLTLADFSVGTHFVADFGLRSFFIVWIVLLSGAALCLLGGRLRQSDPAVTALAAFAVVQASALIVSIAALWGLRSLDYSLDLGMPPVAFVFRILAVSGLASAVWLRYQYVQTRWRQQSRAEALARLDAFQARMRPHFLFNGLNSVVGIMRDDPAAAEELLLDMADVFRAILRQEAKLVPLAQEIGLTRQYLRIEQVRLGSRLQVGWDLDAVPQDALIPPLSLQPLVENAIRHGIEQADRGGRLDIAGRFSRRRLVLTVSNTLPETPGPLQRPGSGEAIANLRARLEVCFADRARVLASVVDGAYQARIVMPYVPARDENPDC